MEERAEENASTGPRDKRRQIYLVFGIPGFGKTWDIVHNIIPRYKRVLIINPNEDDEYKGTKDFYEIDELINYVTEHKIFRVRLRALDQFEDLCIVASQIKDCLLVVEEAHLFIPAKQRISPILRDIFYRGRHWLVSMAISTPRPGSLNIDLRSVKTEVHCFNISENADINWVENAGGCVLTDVNKLEIGDYYHITRMNCEKKSMDDLKKLLTK